MAFASFVAFGALFLIGVVFSWLHAKERLPENRLFYFVGVIAFIFLCSFAVGRSVIWPTSQYDIGRAIVALALPAACASSWVPFLWGAMGLLIFRVARELMGNDRTAEACSFSKADVAEKQRDYQTAKALYLEAIKQMPRRPEPRIRLAELLIRLRRYEGAADQLRSALDLVKGVEARARHAFRLAEVQVMAGQKDAAIETLHRVEADAADTKYAEYARERLAGLS